ncbi:MAG: hypothetical protein NWE82_02590 [Candidatus Bathyarchaeota archaeon]|nr:hypothetical protein [Candidatus Bathyarchaeota archaeon]
MKFTRKTPLTPDTPTTYDKLPDINELTMDEFMELPTAARQKMLRDAMAKIEGTDE